MDFLPRRPREFQGTSKPFDPVLRNRPIPGAPRLALRAAENPADMNKPIRQKSNWEISPSRSAWSPSVERRRAADPPGADTRRTADRARAAERGDCNRDFRQLDSPV